MDRWDATTAKRHFSQIISNSSDSPQVVERHGKPVSVVVSYEEYERSRELKERKSIKGWLSELAEINSREGDMDEPVRIDRPQPDWDER